MTLVGTFAHSAAFMKLHSDGRFRIRTSEQLCRNRRQRRRYSNVCALVRSLYLFLSCLLAGCLLSSSDNCSPLAPSEGFDRRTLVLCVSEAIESVGRQAGEATLNGGRQRSTEGRKEQMACVDANK